MLRFPQVTQPPQKRDWDREESLREREREKERERELIPSENNKIKMYSRDQLQSVWPDVGIKSNPNFPIDA